MSVALALAVTALCLPGISAQQRGVPALSRTQFGLGYVANAPEAMLGGSAYFVSPKWGGIGVYVDVKFDASNPTDEKGYDPDVESSEITGSTGSTFVQTEGSWTSFNVAVIRPLTPYLMGYVGGGVAKSRSFDLYAVPQDSPFGLTGVVWADNPPADQTRANLMVGILMRMTARVTAQFGYETQPNGVTVGASLRLPRW